MPGLRYTSPRKTWRMACTKTQKIGSFFTHGVLLWEYDSSHRNVPRNFTRRRSNAAGAPQTGARPGRLAGLPAKSRNQPRGKSSEILGDLSAIRKLSFSATFPGTRRSDSRSIPIRNVYSACFSELTSASPEPKAPQAAAARAGSR